MVGPIADPSLPASSAESLLPGLRPLWVARYRLRLSPREELVLPYWTRGSVLRGALGIALRRLVCHDLSLFCLECPFYGRCPYPEVFEGARPQTTARLRTFTDVPRPFILDPPPGERTAYRPGEEATFGLTLAGRGSRHIAYFVAAFQSLADEGIGPRRARFRLEAVEALGPGDVTATVFRDKPEVTPAVLPIRASDLVEPGDASLDSLELRFKTPTDLRDGGRPVTRPLFGPLVRRLRDRASALSAFYADAPLAIDFKSLGNEAEGVRLVDDRTRRVAVERPSSRTGQRHDIGGFVGAARYEGAAIGPLMPLVRLGEVIHAGKHAAFGNGSYEVIDAA